MSCSLVTNLICHARICGSVAMTHIPKEKRRQWGKKSEKLIFIGFCETTKGYNDFQSKKGQVSTSRDLHSIEKVIKSD